MKKIIKGEYGYIAYARRMAIIRTAVMFILCAAVFTIGYITTGTRRNLLTIVAVLGCLPASKSLVNVIMFIRARGCSGPVHDRIEEIIGAAREAGTFLFADAYDLYLTSYQKNFPISHVVAGRGMITGLCEMPDCDVSECEKHITGHMQTDGFKDMTVKIYTDTDKYLARLKVLADMDTHESDTGREAMIGTLKAIAL